MYHKSQMRRALSILLVLAFSLGPLATTLEASEDAHVPACCRRLGAHHCVQSMAMASDPASSQPTFTAPRSCPAFPDSTVARISAPHAIANAQASLPALTEQPHAPTAAPAAAQLSQTGTRSGRAPPASFFS